MHPDVFRQLWALSNGYLPHINAKGFERICELSSELSDPDGIKYWGLVSEGLRYRGHPVLRCFNFGNIEIDFPWQVRLVNFGREIPAAIVRSGTVSSPSEPRRLLDKIVKPYLAFCYEADGQLSEHLEPGMLITPAESSFCQRSQFDIVLPETADPPVRDGILYYFMTRRLPFKSEPVDRWVPAGSPSGFSQFRMILSQPVCMEAGWPVLLLEKDRWMWGVVSS